MFVLDLTRVILFTCFKKFQPSAIEKSTADTVSKRLVVWNFQLLVTAKLTLKVVLSFFFVIFFLSLSLKRAHSETELDSETPRKKIFLSAPNVSFFIYFKRTEGSKSQTSQN